MNSSIEDFILLQQEDEKSIRSFKQTVPVNFYHFYLIDEIGSPDRYIQLINTLKTVEEHDTVFIYLNTPGGQVNTTIQIISAMKQCRGTVVTCLEGEVCSAGTMIFLSGDRFYVNPNCSFMIHNYSGGFSGKGNEVSIQIRHKEEYFKRLMMDVYDKFLTEDEIEAVIDGKDLWFSSEEVIERLRVKVGDTDGGIETPDTFLVKEPSEEATPRKAKKKAEKKVEKKSVKKVVTSIANKGNK